VVLYEFKTLSLTLTEEHKLRVFENRVLRRTFGPKRDEVTGGWRKLLNEKLHDLYALQIIARMSQSSEIRWEGHVAGMVAKRTEYIGFWWKPQKKRDHQEDLDLCG
jgi:hypothetical protein